MHNRERKSDWALIIPIMLLIVYTLLSIGKLFQSGNDVRIIDFLDVINSNTFCTFISIVACMIYKYFASEESKKCEDSGLSRLNISITVISTFFYILVAIINACRYSLLTVVIMTIVSICYVFIFFKYMKTKK